MPDSPMILISKEFQSIAAELEKRFEEVAGERVSFSLFCWHETRANYVSNCDRAEIIVALKEIIKGWEEGMPDIPGHEIH